MDKIEYADREICRELVRTAGEKLLAMTELHIEQKTDFKNLVTTADKATQEFLVEEFHRRWPKASFFCEEEGLNDPDGEGGCFIIDPIDGTSNFIFGWKMSAISVGYAVNHKTVWGVVYNPYTDEMFEGERGKGSFLNGKPIHVSDHALEQSLVSFGTAPYYTEKRELAFALGSDIMDYCIDIRRSGSAALDLCYVACGRLGLYIEPVVCAWDCAAGNCIVEEAGGVVKNFRGKEIEYCAKTDIIAGNRENAERFEKEVLAKRIQKEA